MRVRDSVKNRKKFNWISFSVSVAVCREKGKERTEYG